MGLGEDRVCVEVGGERAGDRRAKKTYPPPYLEGAPVSPSLMVRAVVLKQALEARVRGRAAALVAAMRIILKEVSRGCSRDLGIPIGGVYVFVVKQVGR